MLRLFTRNWWMLALRGAMAVLFGMLALIWPGIALQSLVLLFGAYVLVDGALTTWAALTSRKDHQGWALVLLGGLAGIAAGVTTLIWPGITSLVLLFVIAAWAIASGVVELIAAIKLRDEIENEWTLGLAGLLGIVFGAVISLWPGAGALSLVWLIALYVIVLGALLIVLGFRVRRVDQRLERYASGAR